LTPTTFWRPTIRESALTNQGNIVRRKATSKSLSSARSGEFTTLEHSLAMNVDFCCHRIQCKPQAKRRREYYVELSSRRKNPIHCSSRHGEDFHDNKADRPAFPSPDSCLIDSTISKRMHFSTCPVDHTTHHWSAPAFLLLYDTTPSRP
jgi:hypothetical protein